MLNPQSNDGHAFYQDFLASIHVVMVNTTLPANIGSAARAMHTMGLSQLIVIDPKHPLDADAYAHAAGATAILDTARYEPTLEAAIKDFHWVFATSSRQRHIPTPVLTPRQAAAFCWQQYQATLAQTPTSPPLATLPKIALVFGREDRGLTNEELRLAQYHIQIPANPSYPVLNVAAAIQVIASYFFEVAEHGSVLATDEQVAGLHAPSLQLAMRQVWDEPPISREQQHALEQQWLTLLTHAGLYHPTQAKNLPHRVSRLFNRLQLDVKEYQLLNALLAKLRQQFNP